MTAPLAIYLKNQKNKISGSDQEKIFPPISDLLKNIPINKKLPKKIDLCIVGSSFKKFKICQDEFQYIHDNHTPYISATNYISNQICKKESILIAGTYGKTSITSMLAWVFKKAKINISYMFGGVCKDNFPSINFGNSEYSILEADESINGLDQQAKFLYYPVKYLILTSASFEHKESYKNEEENFNSFKKLITRVPQDGLIIANKSGENISKLLKHASAPIVYYDHNNENAVIALCKHLKINKIGRAHV